VLHAFAKADRDWLDPLLDAIADEIGVMIEGKSELFMTRVAARLAPPKSGRRQKPTNPRKRHDNGIPVRYRRPAECRQIDPVSMP